MQLADLYWSASSASHGRAACRYIVEELAGDGAGVGEGVGCLSEHMADVCQMICCGAIYDVVNDSDLGGRLNDARGRHTLTAGRVDVSEPSSDCGLSSLSRIHGPV